jgi:hypothetical protein
MRNLSRLILKMDEELTDVTLVFDGGLFTLYKDDKKSKAYNDREIKTVLGKIDATALDLPNSQKRDLERMITYVKSPSTASQIDISADSKELEKLRLS